MVVPYWGLFDRTENPREEDRAFFGRIDNNDPNYKSGIYLFVKKYIQDLYAFECLSSEQQQKVIGRHKSSDMESADEMRASNSHIALANVEDDFEYYSR